MGRGKPQRKAAKGARETPARRRAAPQPVDRASPQLQRRAVEAALAALAHDVRTPLTGILALADLLIASDLPERERGWARAIRGAADHLAQQTTLVLDAVKSDRAGLAVRKDRFSARKLAEAVAASLSARAGTNGLAADVAIADDLPAQVIGDPVRLRAALENLIDNAVKFTARGRVRFEVAVAPLPRGRTMLRFAVSDSGIGLTRAEIARLFRPFAQASRDVSLRYGGTGLGLALVKRLARAMGGDLDVTSKKGEGSTFMLTAAVQVVPAAPYHADDSAQHARPMRILCVDDNPFGRIVLNAMLTEMGHRIDFAGTSEAAVNAVARGGYDLVLMDVMLPGEDGIEATRRIRALPGETGRVPVIGVSGRSSDEDRRQARAAGMTDYLVKPVNAAALLEGLERLKAEKSPPSP